MSGGCDSYFEYLLKVWLQGNKEETGYLQLWRGAMDEAVVNLLHYNKGISPEDSFLYFASSKKMNSTSSPIRTRENISDVVLPLEDIEALNTTDFQRILEAYVTSRGTNLEAWILKQKLEPNLLEELSCFTGGMFSLAVQFVSNPEPIWDIIAREVTRSCAAAALMSPSGIPSESVYIVPPDDDIDICPAPVYFKTPFDKTPEIGRNASSNFETILDWTLRPIVQSPRLVKKDPRYILRPETFESLYLNYERTGEEIYRQWAYQIYQNIKKHCFSEEYGFTTCVNSFQLEPGIFDEVESFMFAETIKYLWLIFSPRGHFNHEGWIFTTEAHPVPKFKRVLKRDVINPVPPLKVKKTVI
eukprot:GHVP01038003.1.p1 GENE.GHVP01038003.1~~GHVP01038003.1.p1  ORF type:complete len:358 (-),score=64.98 GHVP01038003.1:1487-2560(-)